MGKWFKGNLSWKRGIGSAFQHPHPKQVAPESQPTPPPPTHAYTDPSTGVRAPLTDEQIQAHAQTGRSLEALRQMLMGGQERGINALRSNLAQRGLLDSGSLPAGINEIVGQTQGQLAQGTQAALSGENKTLLDLMEAEKNRQFEREQQQAQMRAQLAAARASRPKWWEYLLQGAGNVAGAATGKFF